MRVETRRAALNQMPWASWIVKVQGGYRGFESFSDYILFAGKENFQHQATKK